MAHWWLSAVPGPALDDLALVEPTKLQLTALGPRLPNLQIDPLFRPSPVLLVFSVLSFFQILGSRESLSIIELGACFGVTLTLGKFTPWFITYVIVAWGDDFPLPWWPGWGTFPVPETPQVLRGDPPTR